MGELHLEIIKDRILKEYKIDADLGPLQIAYREAPIKQCKLTHTTETKIGNSKQYVKITLSLLPIIDCKDDVKDILLLDKTPEAAAIIAKIFPKHFLAIRQGIDAALPHGPKLGCQITNTNIMLHNFEIGRGTSETLIAAATTQCVLKVV